MGWKNSFHFQRGDKNAILILTAILVICGVVYIFSDSFTPQNSPAEVSALDEFDKFQRNLKPIYSNTKAKKDTSNVKPDKPLKIAKGKLQEGQTLDLNNASIAGLKKIPSVGDVFAQRIISYRDALGGFTHTEQLLEAEGISAKKYSNIAPFIRIKKKNKQLRIKRATLEQLSKHPYISDKQARNIIDYRQQKGLLKSIDDLLSIDGFTPRDIDRLSKYLSFD